MVRSATLSSMQSVRLLLSLPLLLVACHAMTPAPLPAVAVSPVAVGSESSPAVAASAAAAPIRYAKAKRVVSMLEGFCAVLDDGGVRCWGEGPEETAPQEIPGVRDAVDVTVGFDYEAGVKVVVARADGAVVVVPAGGGAPRVFKNLRDVVGVHGRVLGGGAMQEALCALHRDRTVTCFEVGKIEPDSTGTLVPEWKDVRALSVGWSHTCALLPAGVQCVEHGGLGKPKTKQTIVPGTEKAVSVEVGHTAVCVGFESGRVACKQLSQGGGRLIDVSEAGLSFGMYQGGWPMADNPTVCTANEVGIQCSHIEGIGSGRSLPSLDAGLVGTSGLDAIEQVVQTQLAGCVRDAKGTVACWGHNHKGALAQPFVGYVQRPVHVPGIPPMKHVEVGDRFTCALSRGGEVWCWGETPKKVASLSGIARIAASAAYACGWDRSGQAFCFFGMDSPRKPVRVPVFDHALAVGLPDMGVLGSVAALFPDGTVRLGRTPGFSSLAGLQLNPLAGVDQVIDLAMDPFGNLSLLRRSGEVLVARLNQGVAVTGPTVVPELRGAVEVESRQARMPDGTGRTWADKPGEAIRWGEGLVSLVGPSWCACNHGKEVVCWSVRGISKRLERVVQASGSQGNREHLCGVDETGAVRCVGENQKGQCGVRVGIESSPTPVLVLLEASPSR